MNKESLALTEFQKAVEAEILKLNLDSITTNRLIDTIYFLKQAIAQKYNL